LSARTTEHYVPSLGVRRLAFLWECAGPVRAVDGYRLSRRRRCSCGSGRKARSSSTLSLRRPRGPESGTWRVGLEVRSTRWDPRTNLLAATSPPPRRRPAEGAMACVESGRDRGSCREVRSGLARLGAPQDRRDGACRRPPGVHLHRSAGPPPATMMALNRRRCGSRIRELRSTDDKRQSHGGYSLLATFNI
jgi:hypothetical protein